MKKFSCAPNNFKSYLSSNTRVYISFESGPAVQITKASLKTSIKHLHPKTSTVEGYTMDGLVGCLYITNLKF